MGQLWQECLILIVRGIIEIKEEYLLMMDSFLKKRKAVEPEKKWSSNQEDLLFEPVSAPP